MTGSPEYAHRTGEGFSSLFRPKAILLDPAAQRRDCTQENLRYAIGIFVAATAAVLALAYISSFGAAAG